MPGFRKTLTLLMALCGLLIVPICYPPAASSFARAPLSVTSSSSSSSPSKQPPASFSSNSPSPSSSSSSSFVHPSAPSPSSLSLSAPTPPKNTKDQNINKDQNTNKHQNKDQIINKDQNIIDNNTKPKYLTVTRFIGGLGDRLRGIISAYYLSLLLDRKLIINEEEAFGEGFMTPALVDWTSLSSTAVHSAAKSLKNLDDFRAEYARHDGNIAAVDFERLQMAEVIDLKSNRNLVRRFQQNPSLHGNPYLHDLSKVDNEGNIWTKALRSLFKPGPKILPLLKKAERERLKNGTFKVGIHLRTDDFELSTPHRPRTSKKRQTNITPEMIACFASKAVERWHKIPKGVRENLFPFGLVVFIATDKERNRRYLEEVLTAANVTFFTGGEYTRSEVRHLEARDLDQTRTFFDWWILTKMNQIIAPPSGFSASAARFNCCPFSLQRAPNKKETLCQGFTEFQSGGICRRVANFRKYLL